MRKRPLQVSFLLFGSGLCALIYQIVWLREFRLIFGASTEASAAVLAIFMGGLGLGSAILGKRADSHSSPLRLYGNFELIIAASAALSPFLAIAVRYIYISTGGTVTLGMTTATVIRLLLSVAVLGVPTFVMGGTLPAAAKAVENAYDVGRKNLSLLYGANTIGAVSGAGLATFYLLERYGMRNTLYFGCLLNVAVALLARGLSRIYDAEDVMDLHETKTEVQKAITMEDCPSTVRASAISFKDYSNARYVYFAAGAVGFAFLLMEIVWYRMLGPILGGSTYTFGIILVMALLGIGLGGLFYSAMPKDRPSTMAGFALTCAVEALLMVIPFALGDNLAIVAGFLKSFSSFGFYGDVVAWIAISAVVVLPSAFVAGVQFPLLIGILGRGSVNVGKHTGLAYAFNTTGAIIGSLAGGFGILPVLTAPVTWQLVVALLCTVSLFAVVLSSSEIQQGLRKTATLAAIALSVIFLLSQGPTDIWRHTQIGVGRSGLKEMTTAELRAWYNRCKQDFYWEAEGTEVSVAMTKVGGINFVVNGKSDGSARGDASTQIMLGMVSGVLHPQPKKALVVGLGTGSSAGWMADIDSVERVDVVELEPAIKHVAKVCAPVNRNAMENPKVNCIVADAREVLLSTKDHYDLIVSEPSNPYRAGIASLYTSEFYRSVRDKLAEGGIFTQWLQAYEVDSRTVQTVYATVSGIFPHVETWQTNHMDLLLVCSMKPIEYDVSRLRSRVRMEPFRSALINAWRVNSLEGFLGMYIGGDGLARHISEGAGGRLNTDDRMLVEFGFARTVGSTSRFSNFDLLGISRTGNWHRPPVKGKVDWDRVVDQWIYTYSLVGGRPAIFDDSDPMHRKKAAILYSYLGTNYEEIIRLWEVLKRPPVAPMEILMVAEAYAAAGNEKALSFIPKLKTVDDGEAKFIEALYNYRINNIQGAAGRLVEMFEILRKNPWPCKEVNLRALKLVVTLVREDKEVAPVLFAALKEPFILFIADRQRKEALYAIALTTGDQGMKDTIFALYEPYPIWDKTFLLERAQHYKETGNSLYKKALHDLETFINEESKPLSDLLESQKIKREQLGSRKEG